MSARTGCSLLVFAATVALSNNVAWAQTGSTGAGTSPTPNAGQESSPGTGTGTGTPGTAGPNGESAATGDASATGGSPAPLRRISLAEASSIARRSAPSVLIALARVRAARVQPDLARTALYPSVSGSTGLNGFVSNGPFFSAGVPVGNVTNVSGWLDMSLSVRWTFWDFGRTARAVEAAQAGVQAAVEDARAAERQAIAQAAAAYLQVLADEALAEQTRETIRQRERQLEITRGLVDAGARAPIEQTRAEVALDAARLDLLNNETAVTLDRSSLAAALGLDPAVPLEVLPPPLLPLDDDPVRAADTAEAQRPELTALRARVLQSEAQVRAARANYYPSLNTSASGSVRYTERSGATGAFSEQANAAVSISVPIFDAAISVNLRLAEANVATARANLAQQALAVRAEAVQAALAVRAARLAAEQAERLATGAAANLAQAEGRYAAGAAGMLELVDAQAADAQARAMAVRARMQLEGARVRLLGAVGRLDVLEGR